MKKISIVLILILQLIIVNPLLQKVDAASVEDVGKPIILLQGENYSQYLTYPGYTIIENNVNFNKCGLYKIKYENEENQITIEKKVYVKSREELVSGNNYNEKFFTLFNKENIAKVQEVKKVDDTYYISYLEEVEDESFNLKFVKITNNHIDYERVIVANVKGRIVDFLINAKKEAILLVEHERTGFGQEVYIYMLDENGNLINIVRYIGEKIEKAKKILEDEENYYVIIETTSETLQNNNINHDYQSIAIFAYNKSTKTNSYFQSITATGNLEVVDAIIANRAIYILTKMYNKDVQMQEFKIHELDVRNLEKINEQIFLTTLAENPKQMITNEIGDIYIIGSDYVDNAYVNKLYKLEKDLKKELIFQYQYPGVANFNLVDALAVGDNQVIMLYNLLNQKQPNSYGYLYQIIQDGKVIGQIEDFKINMYVEKLILSNELLFIHQDKIYIDQISNAIFQLLDENIDIKIDSDIVYPTLYINGKEVLIDQNKSDINYDTDLFGKYLNYYYYTNENVDVIVYGNITVLPNINVKQEEIYDNNFCLQFNGDGFLNNYKITSGYQITTPGKYQLVVKGKDETLHMDFWVEEISTQDIIEIPNELEVNITEKKLSTESSINVNNHIDENSIEKKDDNNEIWTLLIPICTVVLFIVIVAHKKELK